MGCDIKNVKISINLFYIKKISRYLQYILLFMYRVFFMWGPFILSYKDLHDLFLVCYPPPFRQTFTKIGPFYF